MEFDKFEYERVVCGDRGKADIGRHALIGMNDRMNLYAVFLLPGLRILPTPLNKRLENKEMVVESMICRCFIHCVGNRPQLSEEMILYPWLFI